jgi:hypothetical protein
LGLQFSKKGSLLAANIVNLGDLEEHIFEPAWWVNFFNSSGCRSQIGLSGVSQDFDQNNVLEKLGHQLFLLLLFYCYIL